MNYPTIIFYNFLLFLNSNGKRCFNNIFNLKNFIVTISFILSQQLFSQYPSFFSYNDENGLPSNEVYSIVQDNRGIIWIGCDAGLYKFDGVRYTPYHCKTQNSKAISGLTLSSSGRLYCYNFQSQVFYIENNQLKELNGCPPPFITNLTADNSANIYVSYSGGVDVFNEQTKKWKKYGNHNKLLIRNINDFVAKTSSPNSEGKVFALKSNGIETFQKNKSHFYSTSIFKDQSPGLFLLEFHQNKLWILSAEKNQVYHYANNNLRKATSANLIRMLSNRKITYVKSLPDGKLWICTYKGIIKYDAQNDKAELYYPDYAFSDVIIDREGNYWFTSLQAGILRVPNINMLVWANISTALENEKISKIVQGGNFIFFATISGTIGKIDRSTKKLTTYHTGENGDVQSFDYEPTTKTLWFNINNHLYCLKNNSIQQIQPGTVSAVKKRKEIGAFCFLGSSNGLYINDQLFKANYWIRDIVSLENHVAWIATNTGVLILKRKKDKWATASLLLPNIQILSLDVYPQSNSFFALTFDGKIQQISSNGSFKQLAQLPEDVQAYTLKYYENAMYVATNKGLWIFELATRKWKNVNRLNGLASDNIQDITIVDQSIWMATGKGVQKIPINTFSRNKRALIYLNKVINGEKNWFKNQYIELKDNEPLFLFPEAVSYSSNGNFSYAYRIKDKSASWIRLPASIDKIEIQNIPIGEFQIELKVIDHTNHDSENSIFLNGIVYPPYWKSSWFIGLLILLSAAAVYFVFKNRVKAIQRKQHRDIERLNLENELRLSRESALKSQMNPHFVFNVLNSIKAYIYKNDKQHASQYLTDFSKLIRTFLESSNRPEVSLAEELEMLQLYIELEAMLIHHDFTFNLEIDPAIDLTNTFIPSLIIQPFVENAFKHGLHHKKGNKTLNIVVKQAMIRTLEIEIIDNGIGRVAAMERVEKEPHHESFATTAIEKRIQLLNRNATMVSIKYEDLVENEQSAGTKVLLKFTIDE